MKRTKIGDVYAFKTERGYRILQWGYSIEKIGNFVRVFPGFYKEIPSNVESIALSECSYIIEFYISKLYRKGLLELLYSAPVDSIPQLPQYDISYRDYGIKGEYEICEFKRHQNFKIVEGTSDIRSLPKEYQDLKLINGCVDPVWFIYLLTSDFDMHHWDLFYPGKETHAAFMKRYEKQLFS